MAWLLDKLIELALTKNPLNIFYFPTLLWSLLSLDPVYITWSQTYGQGYLHRPYMWPSPGYRPRSRQGGGPQGLT